MFDDQSGKLKNRAPFKEDQRFVVLSPINESYAGPQYDHNPVSAGGVPGDPLGYFPEGTGEVPDSQFRDWPETDGGELKPKKSSRKLNNYVRPQDLGAR